jgi:hypothetical protein
MKQDHGIKQQFNSKLVNTVTAPVKTHDADDNDGGGGSGGNNKDKK